jgi:hypothetical protein
VTELSAQLLRLTEPILNLNHFMLPLDQALESAFEFVGGVQQQAFQDNFLKAFEKVCSLMD